MPYIEQQTFAFGLTDEPERAWACYTVNGVENEFELTNVCNALGDMLSSMVTLLANPSQLWDEGNTVGFVWYCDSDSYNWTLTLGAGQVLTVRITQTCEFFGDDEVEIVNAQCNVFEFMRCIIEELDRFIKKCGLLNFLQTWRANEFPLSYFLYLKKHLMDDGLWECKMNGKGSTLDDEMALLLG